MKRHFLNLKVFILFIKVIIRWEIIHPWSANSLFSYPPNCFIIIKLSTWCLITMLGIVNHRLQSMGSIFFVLCCQRLGKNPWKGIKSFFLHLSDGLWSFQWEKWPGKSQAGAVWESEFLEWKANDDWWDRDSSEHQRMVPFRVYVQAEMYKNSDLPCPKIGQKAPWLQRWGLKELGTDWHENI